MATIHSSIFRAFLALAAVASALGTNAVLAKEPANVPLGSDPSPATRHFTPCINGTAAGYACSNVDLLENLPLATFGPGTNNTNDIWGWTDPATGREYTLLGLNNGTAFIDVTVPDHAVYLGKLPTHSVSSLWRSIKVYQNYAFIGSEAAGHGLQIFDLTQLRNVQSPPVTFQATQHYAGFSTNHTVEIDTETGFLYAAGSNTCGGGEHIVDIRQPLKPVFAGCFGSDGYTHEAQCTVYRGPDADHVGKEICMACNIDTLTILDVTNKSAVSMISRTGYAGNVYAHQGWLTEDHQYFILNDELDEGNFGHPTKTYIWDVRNLDAPTVIGTHLASTTATDHNLYIRGNYVYQTNYNAGLHILSLDAVAAGQLTEVAFFDSEPGAGDGTWTNYPYFASGIVVVSDIDRGLFILKPNLCVAPELPTDLQVQATGDNQLSLAWTGNLPVGGSYQVRRAFGGCPAQNPATVATGLTSATWADTVAGGLEYAYTVSAVAENGLCQSAPSVCVSGTTTGVCNAPPAFAGLDTVSNSGAADCGLDLVWPAASSRCGGSQFRYAVFRGEDANFVPQPANRLVNGLAGTAWRDTSIEPGRDYFYVVRATDLTTGAEDDNRMVRSGRASGPVGPGSFAAGAEPGDPILETGGAVRHLGWEIASERARTGLRSYSSSYLANSCLAMSLPDLPLVAGGHSTLSFWTSFGLVPGDGGQLQISTDAGETWSLLTPDQGYPGAMTASSDACGLATGSPAFTGTLASFSPFSVDLAAYQGQTVRIRFLFSSDGSNAGQPWYLDDLRVTDAEVPGSCRAGLLFGDGFELGNTTAWATSTP